MFSTKSFLVSYISNDKSQYFLYKLCSDVVIRLSSYAAIFLKKVQNSRLLKECEKLVIMERVGFVKNMLLITIN